MAKVESVAVVVGVTVGCAVRVTVAVSAVRVTVVGSAVASVVVAVVAVVSSLGVSAEASVASFGSLEVFRLRNEGVGAILVDAILVHNSLAGSVGASGEADGAAGDALLGASVTVVAFLLGDSHDDGATDD